MTRSSYSGSGARTANGGNVWLESSRPRILCHFNHYFGISSTFKGKSTVSDAEQRGKVVRSAIGDLRALPLDIEIRVCGLPDCSLLPIDIDLSAVIEDPQLIVYASIERMFDAIEAFDYFLNIEDDVSISFEVLRACMAFNDKSNENEVYLPNRMEVQPDGTYDCVDLVFDPSWKPALARNFGGTILGVAANPHSGLAFLSRRQMQYAAERVNPASREHIIGGMMASAYANLHAPFLLWRARSDLRAHHVVHLDHWLDRPTASAPDNPAPGPTTPRVDSPCAEPIGHVDALVLEGAFLKLQGWAVTADGRAANEVRLRLGDNEFTAESPHDLTRIDRPDVIQIYPNAPLACGFELVLPASPLFAMQNTAPVRLAFEFRPKQSESFSPLPSALLTRAVAGIEAAIATLPVIPDTPFMPAAVTDRLLELMRTADCYLEYGTGGSTMQAQAIGVPDIVAVESDPLWLEGVRFKSGRSTTNSRCNFIHADIGPTGALGCPNSDSHWKNYHRYALLGWKICRDRSIFPDLILIDGRFRVACALAALLFGKPGCRFLIDDYVGRSYSTIVERFIMPAQTVDRAAEFVVPTELPRNEIFGALLEAVTDPA